MKFSLSIFVILFALSGYNMVSANNSSGATEEYMNDLDGQRDSGLVRVKDFGDNPGNLEMYKFIPVPEPKNAPLIVVLHGTTQNSHGYACISEWNKLAQRYGLILLYPEQRKRNNPYKAFSWFSSSNCQRFRGESGSVMQMIDKMKSDHLIDSKKVFVTGLSSGGCFTAALCAVYPDIFAGGAIIAGIPFGAATNPIEGFNAMLFGVTRDPEEWAKIAKNEYPEYCGKYPKMIVLHGNKDCVVDFGNMREIMKQFTALHNTDSVPDVTGELKGHPHNIYKNSSGESVVETIEILNMGHGIAIDPGDAADQGGNSGAFAISANLYSSYYFLKLWGLIE
ncbi:MAG: PHB depolymerase family esterase [Candidatus Riflebacteria bacterium]|nr:PHB depolymerase family esterase [Candidatus Riflebacteria bacterium]